MSGEIKVGDSPVSRSFGAKTTVPDSGMTMALVVGAGKIPTGLIALYGGSTLVEIPGGSTMLVQIPMNELASLNRHPAVRTAGPINVDPERFTAFARLVGAEHPGTEPGEAGE